MMSGESRAVVVGNAEPELREWANTFKSENQRVKWDLLAGELKRSAYWRDSKTVACVDI